MSTPDAPARFAPAHLRAFAASVYERLGVPPEDAALVADTLVRARLAVEGVPVPPTTLEALDAGAARLGVPRLGEVARRAPPPAG